jgi:hypothetical protein
VSVGQGSSIHATFEVLSKDSGLLGYDVLSLSGWVSTFRRSSKESLSARKGQDIEEEFTFLDVLSVQP